jgi:hypothetical protein
VAQTHPAAAPTFPPGRYGRRRPNGQLPRTGAGRRLSLLLGTIGAVVGLLVAGVLYVKHGNPTYQPTVVGFDLRDDRATVRFRVHKPADRPAVCHLRAMARSGAQVGAADVAVPLGGDVEVTHTFATSGPPMAVELTGCGPQDR